MYIERFQLVLWLPVNKIVNFKVLQNIVPYDEE